jgi:hypothetical protein
MADCSGDAADPPAGCDGPVTITVSLAVGVWASQKDKDGGESTVFNASFDNLQDCQICPTASQVCAADPCLFSSMSANTPCPFFCHLANLVVFCVVHNRF